MTSPLELAVRQHLTDYLAGNLSLDEFKDWLVGATWDVERTADADTQRLTYDIKLALAEESSGFVSTAEMDEELRSIARRVPAVSAH